MRINAPGRARPIYICDFCGMSSMTTGETQFTHCEDAVICSECVTLAQKIFRQGSQEVTVQSLHSSVQTANQVKAEG